MLSYYLKQKHIMKKTIIPALTVILILVLSPSCSDYSYNSDFDKRITDLVPDELFDAMDNLDMPIYKGQDPPVINGNFLAKPIILLNTNVDNDYAIGTTFADYFFRFSNQKTSQLEVDFAYKSGGEEGTGLGAFMSGSGSEFSVFIKGQSSRGGSTVDMLTVVSGEVKGNAIKNFHMANFMLDDHGDPGNAFMGNNTGRVFHDSDGESPSTIWLPGMKAVHNLLMAPASKK